MPNSRKPMCFVATSKPEHAQIFYGGVLGLDLIDASPFALVFDDCGTQLRVQIVEDLTPAPFTVHGWEVADIEAEMTALRAKGVAFTRFDGLDQDDQDVWTSPDGHRIAWFTDPDGNTLSLTQFA